MAWPVHACNLRCLHVSHSKLELERGGLGDEDVWCSSSARQPPSSGRPTPQVAFCGWYESKDSVLKGEEGTRRLLRGYKRKKINQTINWGIKKHQGMKCKVGSDLSISKRSKEEKTISLSGRIRRSYIPQHHQTEQKKNPDSKANRFPARC